MKDIMKLNWGGDGFPSYEVRLDAAAPAPTTGAPSSGAPAASPTAGVPSPVPPTGTGAPPASPTGTAPTDGNAENIAVLRQSHDNLRSLGVDFATAKTYTATMGKLFTEASTLAEQLGYTTESFKEAWGSDPVDTLALLRQEARAQRDRPRDATQDAIDAAVKQRTAPIENYVARQQAEQHNRFIEGEFATMFDSHAVLKGIKDPDVRQDLKDRYIETVKWNNDVLKEVMQGKSSGLKKVFDEVANNWLKVVAAYNKTSAVPAPGGAKPGTTPTNGEAKEFTLDDIIEGNDKANFLPSMRGFR